MSGPSPKFVKITSFQNKCNSTFCTKQSIWIVCICEKGRAPLSSKVALFLIKYLNTSYINYETNI